MLRMTTILTGLLLAITLSAEVRLKDITSIENAKQDALIGYGLVIGLDGTGDRSSGNRGAIFTVQTISNMLERFGITVPKDYLRTRNVAAVMVTSNTPAYGRVGSHFDVTVSSLGDASSLEGGVLLMTPLRGMDGTHYGLAQGSVSVGGFNIETDSGEKLKKNHALVGRVPNGGVLERAANNLGFQLDQPVRFLLNEPDFGTASRIADKINTDQGQGNTPANIAKPLNAGVVEVSFPASVTSQDEAVFFIADVEILMVQPDVDARVVINERTGTVVTGGNVRINEIMISHGALTIHVRRTPIISQPMAAFSNVGQTVVEYVTETKASEGEVKNAVIKETTSVSDLAAALNELGMRPRDVISIFQALKQAGALNARLIII
ncbi:MAG: flagellar basal body P-ring protein FlgI [Candidatus Marinimicrobia bacterium]|nr:flagellar basal body P-ring protein FlgI [Candidatus Neomarinimicrobiota bacterium]